MKKKLRMDNFLKYVVYIILLFIWLGGCSGGCSSDNQKSESGQAVDSDPLVLIVKQRSDTTSIKIAAQLTKSLNYTKIPYESVDLDLRSEGFQIPESVQILSITTTEIEVFSDKQFHQILDFVASGNTLFLTGPVFGDRFNFLTGIKKQADYEVAEKAEGFRFNSMVFPGFKDGKLKLKNPFYHDGLSQNVFRDDVEVIAHSYDSTRAPVITKNTVAGGRVVMFNSVTGYDKLYRGLLFSIMVSSLQNIPYPVANVSSVFLDDFPLPLYKEKSPPIDWEYNVTEEAFITKIWWPDMQTLADSFGIDYTAILAFTYNANVVPPFDFNEWEASSIQINNKTVNGSIWLAKQVKNSRHELGFHGYNHFSLLADEWPKKEFMISALKAARKRWSIDKLGPLPVTYVPPTNNIDSTGIEALARGMPQIKNLSSLYLEYAEEGGGREFGPDPYNSDLYDYPRISSGFLINDIDNFNIQGLYILSGIWTHFVHPDDVFQVKQRKEDDFVSRNELGLGWRKSKDHDFSLYTVFRDYLEQIEQTYPLINYKTVKAAVPVVKDWRALQVKRGKKDSLIYATKQNNKNQFSTWFMYVKATDRDSVEKYVQRQAQEYHFISYWDGYLLQFSSRKDSLTFPQPQRTSQVYESPEEIRDQYLSYRRDEKEASETSGDWRDTRLRDARAALRRQPSSRTLQDRVINLAIEFEQVPLAIDILEQRLLKNDLWNSNDVEQLLTYYGWENASDRAFTFLEQLWKKYPDDSIITLKEMMVNRFGTPSEDFETKWLNRELALNPGDEQVLQELVLNNQSEESWPEAQQYIDRLIAQNPESDSLYFYKLQHSFYYDEPPKTLSMLSTFPAEANTPAAATCRRYRQFICL